MIDLVLEERYPKQTKLQDGTRIMVRPYVPTDELSLVNFFKSIPPEDLLYLRDNVKDPAVIQRWTKHLNYEVILPVIAEINGKIIVDCTLHQNRGGWKGHIGTIRIVIHPEYRGKGLATFLLSEMVQVALDSGLSKLEAEFMPEQKTAFEVFENLGFVRLATLPQHVKDLQGDMHDLLVYVYDLRATEHYAAD